MAGLSLFLKKRRVEMIIGGIDYPVLRRLWAFQLDAFLRGCGPRWVHEQEEGIEALKTEVCNNDEPCRYARSRGE